MDIYKTFPIFTSLNLITKKNRKEKVSWLFLLGGEEAVVENNRVSGKWRHQEHHGPQLSRDIGGQAPTSPPCPMEKNPDPSLKWFSTSKEPRSSWAYFVPNFCSSDLGPVSRCTQGTNKQTTKLPKPNLKTPKAKHWLFFIPSSHSLFKSLKMRFINFLVCVYECFFCM